jgi:hypothetical protein
MLPVVIDTGPPRESGAQVKPLGGRQSLSVFPSQLLSMPSPQISGVCVTEQSFFVCEYGGVHGEPIGPQDASEKACPNDLPVSHENTS